jgi:prolyl-tRNA editing enzyme YbaK/EbsC (Cys-tRNA(Pro) deacylase)
VDEAVTLAGQVVVGSGLRRSKIELPGADLARLPRATVVPDLGRSTS